MDFDERTSRHLVSVYMTPDIVEQRRLTVAALDLQPREDVLDIGAGPGFLACEMAAVVGEGGSVQGVDPSASMLAIAVERERAPGSAPVEFREGDALALPFDDDSFDAAVSTQVYEYVEDMPAALAEARRVVRPGGRLLVLDTDWDSIVWRSGDRERMGRILAAWDEHLADPHLPARLSGLLTDAGFTIAQRTTIPILNTRYGEASYSNGLIGFVSAFVTGRQGITEDEAKAWADDLAAQGEDYFFSINRYVFVASA
jgi:ubiquinone/menaquinone biosynthesis C-methylase UbiE